MMMNSLVISRLDVEIPAVTPRVDVFRGKWEYRPAEFQKKQAQRHTSLKDGAIWSSCCKRGFKVATLFNIVQSHSEEERDSAALEAPHEQPYSG